MCDGISAGRRPIPPVLPVHCDDLRSTSWSEPRPKNMPSDRSPSVSLNEADTDPDTYAPKLPTPTLTIG